MICGNAGFDKGLMELIGCGQPTSDLHQSSSSTRPILKTCGCLIDCWSCIWGRFRTQSRTHNVISNHQDKSTTRNGSQEVGTLLCFRWNIHGPQSYHENTFSVVMPLLFSSRVRRCGFHTSSRQTHHQKGSWRKTPFRGAKGLFLLFFAACHCASVLQEGHGTDRTKYFFSKFGVRIRIQI